MASRSKWWVGRVKRRLQRINDAKDELIRLLRKYNGILLPPKREYGSTAQKNTYYGQSGRKEDSYTSEKTTPPKSMYLFQDLRKGISGCLWHGKKWGFKPSLPKGWFYAANSQKHSKQVWTKLSGSPEVLIQQLEQFWRDKGLLV